MPVGEALQRRFARIYLYVTCWWPGTAATTNQAAMGRAGATAARLGAAISFVEPEIASLPDGTVESYLSAEPRLAPFRRRVERVLSNKPHLLSPETEKVLASLGELMRAPYTLYERAKSSDMRFEPVTDSHGREHPVSFATYEVALEKSADTVLRRNAYASFTTGLSVYKEVLGGTFGAEVRKNVVLARARGFESATHMFLHAQEVSMRAYTNLLDIIQSRLAPYMRRYVELRRQVLGLDEVLYCDIEAPLDPEYDPEVTYEEACEEIIEAASVMGPEFTEIVATALSDRWIDRADNVGKSTGAFCADAHDAHPYILTTGRQAPVHVHAGARVGPRCAGGDDRADAAVREQEMSRFAVEAPSTFMEALLARHLLAKAGGGGDRRQRRWVLMRCWRRIITTMCGTCSRRSCCGGVSAGGGRDSITASVLSRTEGEILEQFWGGVVKIDDGARLTWMRQPTTTWAVSYTYSAGLTCSTLMAQALEGERRGASGG